MTVVWGFALAAALLWPGTIIGPLDGAPLDTPLEVFVIALLLPATWVLYPALLKSRASRILIVLLLAWKAITWIALPQAGWCGTFLTKYPPPLEGFRRAQGWDARTWFERWPSRCTDIVARGYSRQTQFPAWILNVPFGIDRDPYGVDFDRLPVENPRPPNADFVLYVHGYFEAPSAGTFSILTGGDVRLDGAMDGQSIASAGGASIALPLAAGRHEVAVRLDLTGRAWRFVPLWNGTDVFSTTSTATTDVTPFQRLVLRYGKHLTTTLVVLLVGLWLQSAYVALRPEAKTLLASLAVAVAAAILGSAESPINRWAPIAMAFTAPIAVADRLKNWRSAWMLLSVPWLAMTGGLGFKQIGGFTLFTFGDDMLTYQRFAYRIFMEGFWIEGGQRTFWNQPLYRWICGGLHLIFGDSSVGELILDAFALLAGGMFAFTIVRRFASFRWALSAAVCALLTIVVGPNWYMLGRGLPEMAATLFVYLAAFALLKAREGSTRSAIAAGLFAAVAFFTRLNHLLLVLTMVALLLPETAVAADLFRWRRTWAKIPFRPACAYLLCLVAALGAFAMRTWYYTGRLSIFGGTTIHLNGTGLGQTLDSWWSPTAWTRAFESVLMIVTVQDPPRFDIRSVLVVAGFGCALLGPLGMPAARRLPLGLVVMCVGAVMGGLVARGVAYPGRFSVHLIPIAVAIAMSTMALATTRRAAETDSAVVLSGA